ncbi:sulfurtransferase-like selenium metabolism protein YedF [Orenia marismortui]|uniref:sulfurtransferase-like selenium metabolism protein YedF n=1 Tax=Orenia marismortui TaxID=46469 RepID=UPI000373E383|nr:sulfurtransferase-like selenium metabolism protein YedF [Orenia marismortui]
MKKIDARGLACPKPVIETKKALEDYSKVVVTVDNKVAADNVSKLATKLGAQVSVLEEEREFILTIIQNGDHSQESNTDKLGKVYFIKSDTLGEGEQELGEVLMKGFIATLLEVNPLPDKIIFINSGVKVPTLNAEAKENLHKLEQQGVKVLSCGTCLEYYGLKDKLQLGNISNMYEILDSLNMGDVVEV